MNFFGTADIVLGDGMDIKCITSQTIIENARVTVIQGDATVH